MTSERHDDTQVDYFVRGQTSLTRETIMGEKWIRWAYQNQGRGIVAKLLFSNPWLSRVMGWWFDSEFSAGKITSAIEDLGVDEAEFSAPTRTFRSFNEFFYRRLKPESRPFDSADSALCSPADGRVLAFPTIEGDTLVPVKGCDISLNKLIGDGGERYHGGSALMVRLCPADYHRFHFPCTGILTPPRWITGGLHSVNPIALASGVDVFCENHRCVTEMDTPTFGKVAYIEVGAFGVGSIVHTVSDGEVAKMDEKGYFKFGGSSVALIFEPGRVTFSDDLLANTEKGFETLIKVGETVGTCRE